MNDNDTSRLLLGVCGLYCGACFHYRATFPEGAHLLDWARSQGRNLEGFLCSGCRSDVLSIRPGCSQCRLRACAESKDLLHCGLCADFPCDLLTAFRNDGKVHHLDVFTQLEELREMGADPWLVEQEQRWTCTCGARFSWYEITCQQCGAALASYG